MPANPKSLPYSYPVPARATVRNSASKFGTSLIDIGLRTCRCKLVSSVHADDDILGQFSTTAKLILSSTTRLLHVACFGQGSSTLTTHVGRPLATCVEFHLSILKSWRLGHVRPTRKAFKETSWHGRTPTRAGAFRPRRSCARALQSHSLFRGRILRMRIPGWESTPPPVCD